MIGRIPAELIESISKGDCVILIGAGLSIGVGMPSWNQLIRPLAVEIDAPPEANLPTIAQVYAKRYGRRRLEAHVRSSIDSTDRSPSDNHELLCRLGSLRATFVTTNYDDLLEQTFRQQGQRFKVVVRDDDVAHLSNDVVHLIKVHGHKDQEGTMVLTLRDYLTLFKHIPLIENLLTLFFASKTFLFVGYSLQDVDLQHIQAKVSSHLSPHARKSYAVLDGLNDFDRDFLDAFEVIAISLEKWGEGNTSQKLTRFLIELHTEIICYQNSKSDIPKSIHAFPEAQAFVPTDLVLEMNRQGRSLVGCIDFMIYVDLVDANQYNWELPNLKPYSTHSQRERNIRYYEKVDGEKNIHQGLAFFM